MPLIRNLIAGLRSLLSRQQVDRDLDEELDGYLEASAAHKQRAGMAPEHARRAALVELGSRNAVKHQVWSSRWESALETLLQDLRVSLRGLARSPGFTLVALLSLALGIGGNTAIFTLIHQVLLRSLPVREPQQLVSFGHAYSGGVLGGIDLSTYDMYTYDFAQQLAKDPGPFQSIASYNSTMTRTSVRTSADTNQPATQVATSLVSGNYFTTLGATPLFGRTLTAADETAPGANPVVVLSHHFWQQLLSSNPQALGRSVNVNGTPFTIIGVMPENFHGLSETLNLPDLWIPLTMQPQVTLQPSMLAPRSLYILHLFAREQPNPCRTANQHWLDTQIHNYIRAGEGVTIPQERQAEIERITQPLIPAAHGVSELQRLYGDSLGILMAVVAVVLLIACANLANFVLARAATRQREIATRLALGSSRARILRQGLVETLLLSLTGGLLGLGVAFLATRALIAFVSQGHSYMALNATPDRTVLLFTLAISLATGMLFGLIPAINTARTEATGTLTATARTGPGSGGRTARLWPQALVAAQVMLSLLLVVAAGLFLRTLNNLQTQNFGFSRNHLLLAEFDARIAGYRPEATAALHQRMLEQLAALPGVQSASLSLSPPISMGNWSSSMTFSGYTSHPKENTNSVLNRVTGHYFETVGIHLLQGRTITPDDSATSLQVAVINQAVAQHFFPHGDAIGHTLTIDSSSVPGAWRIIGIVENTRAGNPREEPGRMVYLPLAQIPPTEPGPAGTPIGNNDRFANTIELRTLGDPDQAVHALRNAMAGIDPNIPILSIRTIEEQLDLFMADEALISRLTGLFSLLALLLAAIGLYGVMSYAVIRRTSEIGIRLALGAHRPAIQWMVLRESLQMLAIGLALGLPLTLAGAAIIRKQLYGVHALDPATFLTAIAVVTTMTLLATGYPAHRATRINPMVALRAD